jgi:hypothetical protein
VRAALVLVAVVACGRIDFDELPQIPILQTTSQLGMNMVDTLPLAATRPGSVIIVATSNISTGLPVVSIGDDAGSPYVAANATFTCGGATLGELWFARTTHSATALTITSDSAVMREIWVIEVGAPIELDGVLHVDATAESGTAQLPQIAPSHTPALVLSAVDMSGNAETLLTAQFVELDNLHGDEAAYVVANTAGVYGAAWMSTAVGFFCGVTAAFVLP